MASSQSFFNIPLLNCLCDDDEISGGLHSKKRRLSVQQVRSLETSFETESKLEPAWKMQLVAELGLQPRQVAVWFQNRRARWKMKQLERDYNDLKQQYEEVVTEKKKLEGQLRIAFRLEIQAESHTQATAPADCQSHARLKMNSLA